VSGPTVPRRATEAARESRRTAPGPPFRARRPGLLLAAGLALTVLAALAPAGLRGEPVPARSWLLWLLALGAGLEAFRREGSTLPQLVRRVAWLVPFVLTLALPAALVAPPGRRLAAAAALVARALAATLCAAGTAFLLGPTGLVRGARDVGLPDRLAAVLEATLVGLTAMVERARGMLRAREARRTGPGAWGLLLREPVATLRGFGRFGAALLLRTLERAEAQERARLARGADLP
jgi:energy-coupling factor transporter transmembrane protein EcfT